MKILKINTFEQFRPVLEAAHQVARKITDSLDATNPPPRLEYDRTTPGLLLLWLVFEGERNATTSETLAFHNALSGTIRRQENHRLFCIASVYNQTKGRWIEVDEQRLY
jgi:hypothetical protein